MRHMLLLLVSALCLTYSSIGATPARLSIELVPKIVVRGDVGSQQWVEWSPSLEHGAVWQVLTNVTIGTEPFVTVDLGAAESQRFYRVTDAPPKPKPPLGMVPIQAGPFEMGDSFDDWIEPVLEHPVHTVYVSGYFMDKHEVSKALWDEVQTWSERNGYAFNIGSGRAPSHPVQTVSWYDVVKWCNARSEMEGRVPEYYSDEALTKVYRAGELAPFARWGNGYRLPTEAEWEKAARGGAVGRRFPWSDVDSISHSQANYYSTSADTYDVSRTRGLHPTYSAGDYTSPVGTFPPNDFGLHDMAGNVWEWCWDWQDWYPSSPQTDPRGGAKGTYRVTRGGGWYREAIYSRVAYRGNSLPDFRGGGTGFRTVITMPRP